MVKNEGKDRQIKTSAEVRRGKGEGGAKHGDVVEAEAILMKRSFISFPNYYEVRRSVHMMNDKGINFDCLQSSEMPSSTSSNSTKYVIRNT